MSETLGDCCIVAGTLVAGDFGRRGFIVRRGFESHEKVRRFLAKYGNPAFDVFSLRDFEQLKDEVEQQ